MLMVMAERGVHPGCPYPTRLPDGSHRLALAEVLNQTETEGRSGAGLEAESTFNEGS
jgi:hypothetical protein